MLENGVSQYPKLEGRFPQVAGVSFGFDPTETPGSRVDPQFIRIGDEYLSLEQRYKLATKKYIANGKDGYDCLKNSKILVSILHKIIIKIMLRIFSLGFSVADF
jgi:5'-nucleotidase